MAHKYDNFLLPFGKYKFTGLSRLPASYLLGIYGDKVAMHKYPEIKEWIEYNMSTLKSGNGITKNSIPSVIMPCNKYLYLTEREARKELHRISQTDSVKKPVRFYSCDKCGGWHLTSKQLVEK